MGKYIKRVFIICLFVGILCVKCNALTDDDTTLENFLSAAPESFEYSELAEKISFDGVIGTLLKTVEHQFKNCASVFVSVVCIVLLYSVICSLSLNSSDKIKNIYAVVLSTAIVGICLATVQSNIDIIKDAVDSMNVFTSAAVPIIAAFCISAGQSFSAAVFSSFAALGAAAFEYVSKHILMPLSIVYFSFGLIGALQAKRDGALFEKYIKKAIKWLTGIFVAVFTFSLSMQSFLSQASDGMVKSGIKAAVGGMLPTVGSTLSGGIDSMFTLAQNSKTSFSLLGIIIIVSIFLPPIIGNACYGAALYCAGALASFLGVNEIEHTISVVSDTFFILSGICAACVYMTVASFLIICINV